MGPVFALAERQENIIEELFSKYVFAPSQICIRTFAPSIPIHESMSGESMSGELISVQIHVGKYTWRIHSHAGKYRRVVLVNYLCIGFVPGGTTEIVN